MIAIARIVVVLLAVAAAIAPVPASVVERWYSTDLYSRIQPLITRTTNDVPIALLDPVAAFLIVLAVTAFVRRLRRGGIRVALLRTLASTLVACAVLYLAFLTLWGFNYRRVPLERKLDYDRSRVTRDAAVTLGNEAVSKVNGGYTIAHTVPADAAVVERAFADVQRSLGAVRLAAIGRPKRSVLEAYFRRAAIDGMTDPFFLEIILNPDVLPVERPFVLVHEWAHLAGYADESEANFIAWLTCVRGDGLMQYSGWLVAYEYAVRALSREDRRLLRPLETGPRSDLRAISERYGRSSPIVRNAARDAYDTYLRANRVTEGIASYDAVLRLILGSRFDEQGRPILRP